MMKTFYLPQKRYQTPSLFLETQNVSIKNYPETYPESLLSVPVQPTDSNAPSPNLLHPVFQTKI